MQRACGFLLIVVVFLSTAQAQTPEKASEPTKAEAKVAAVVNGETVSLEDVDAIIRRSGPFDSPLTVDQIHSIRTAIAQEMIDQLLVKQFLKKNAPPIEKAELDQHLAALAESQQKLGKSLADFYRDTKQNEAQLRESWTAMLQLQKLVDRQATDVELRKYYNENKDFFDRTTVRASQIVARVHPGSPPGERATALQNLKLIRKQIVDGTITFAAAAKKYSIDTTSSHNGDLGYIVRKDPLHEESLTQAAFALKVGEVSEPIEIEQAMVLIQVTDRRPGRGSKYEECLPEVRECYIDDVRKALIGKLRRQAEIKMTIP